jgi:hypothetical protein
MRTDHSHAEATCSVALPACRDAHHARDEGPTFPRAGCSQASSFNNVCTSGLQSLWLLHHLLGRVPLPKPTELHKVEAATRGSCAYTRRLASPSMPRRSHRPGTHHGERHKLHGSTLGLALAPGPPPAPEQDILDQQRWRGDVMPEQRFSSSVIMLYQQRYHDQLVRLGLAECLCG